MEIENLQISQADQHISLSKAPNDIQKGDWLYTAAGVMIGKVKKIFRTNRKSHGRRHYENRWIVRVISPKSKDVNEFHIFDTGSPRLRGTYELAMGYLPRYSDRGTYTGMVPHKPGLAPHDDLFPDLIYRREFKDKGKAAPFAVVI